MRYHLLLLLIVSSLLLASCGRRGRTAGADPSEVFVLGVSTLDPGHLQEMIDRGELPNFQEITKGGSWGRLSAEDPMSTASLWADLQTGKNPRWHRVFFDLETLPNGLIYSSRSTLRNSMSVWQMLSEMNHPVAVVGLPVSWPAEMVRGHIVSNAVIPNRWTQTSEVTFSPRPGQRQTFPNQLYEEIEELLYDPDSITREELSRFFVLNERDFAMAYDEPLGSIFHYENPLRDFVFTHQADLSYLRVVQYLRKRYRPELSACFLELPAVVSPVYWPYLEPEVYPVDKDDLRRFRNAVDESYRWVDERLGEILESLSPGATLIVASEKGYGTVFHQDADGVRRPHPESKPEGLIILYGHGIARGHQLHGASIYDLTPTLLTLFGERVGDDLQGRCLSGAFNSAFGETHKAHSGISYESQWDRSLRFEKLRAMDPASPSTTETAPSSK